MHQTKKEIDTQIQTRYSQYAKQVSEADSPLAFNADGCAPNTVGATNTLAERLYTEDVLHTLPSSVVDAALGCGNPLAIAALKPNEHVLDLGSGGGIDCFLAAKAVGPTGYVIGVDATPDMIVLANQNKVKMDLTNVEFRLGNIEALPVDSQSTDQIISNCVIDISPDKSAVFAEAYRVLKPGGRLAISDTVILGQIEPQLKANIDVWAGAVITPLVTLSEFLNFIVEAGFIDIQVDSLTSYGLENFDQLDEVSQQILSKGGAWYPLPANTGLYSACISARKSP